MKGRFEWTLASSSYSDAGKAFIIFTFSARGKISFPFLT
jgi:hypothetical protein